MKDSELYNQLTSARQRVAMVYRQSVFLDTRLAAIELVLFQRFTWFWLLVHPEMVIKQINSLHLTLMKKHDDDMKADAAKESKPKIQIVGSINGR